MPAALGLVAGAWALTLPEPLLRAWFDPAYDATAAAPGTTARTPAAPPTLYGLLGVPPTADADTIRSGYRRLARSLHPDVNREPDAHERFLEVKRAYDTLSDPATRARYDGVLAFAASLPAEPEPVTAHRDSGRFGYQPPLRCGWLVVQGHRGVGGLHVTRIIDWQDITDDQGRVMVASWRPGASAPEITWL